MSVTFSWNKGFKKRRKAQFSAAQSYIDQSVLRGCAKYVPLRTGVLVKSGTLGTVVGSGEVKYIAPYARRQYYENKGRGVRGRLWFERWKAEHKEQTLREVKQYFKE